MRVDHLNRAPYAEHRPGRRRLLLRPAVHRVPQIDSGGRDWCGASKESGCGHVVCSTGERDMESRCSWIQGLALPVLPGGSLVSSSCSSR